MRADGDLGRRRRSPSSPSTSSSTSSRCSTRLAAAAPTAWCRSTPRARAAGEDAATYADSLGEIDERYELVEDGARSRARCATSRARARVLELRFGEDLTQSEIAERIGVSQMHVSRLLRHALEQLRILRPRPRAEADADALTAHRARARSGRVVGARYGGHAPADAGTR